MPMECWRLRARSYSRRCGRGPTALASPGWSPGLTLVEMQIFRSQPQTYWIGVCILMIPRWFVNTLKFERHWFKRGSIPRTPPISHSVMKLLPPTPAEDKRFFSSARLNPRAPRLRNTDIAEDRSDMTKIWASAQICTVKNKAHCTFNLFSSPRPSNRLPFPSRTLEISN